jgi:hypothetical protein
MSEIFDIQISRGRAITVAGCLIAAGVLLFAAGTVAGLLMASASVQSQLSAAQLPAVKPLAEPAKKITAARAPSDSGAPSEAGASGEAMTAVVAASQTAAPTAGPLPQQAASAGPQPPAPASKVPAPPLALAASAAPPAPASSSRAALPAASESAPGLASASADPSAESSYAIPLAIKVCSFTGKASAEAMIAALAAKGYRASLGHSSGANGRTWYVVKLGPYKAWNTASDVAARVAIAENVRPVIGPMR